MEKGQTINEDVREFIQEWFVKPQLLDSDGESNSKNIGNGGDVVCDDGSCGC